MNTQYKMLCEKNNWGEGGKVETESRLQKISLTYKNSSKKSGTKVY